MNAKTKDKKEQEEVICLYEVKAEMLHIAGVIAYRGARLQLTKEQAEKANKALPGSIVLLGI